MANTSRPNEWLDMPRFLEEHEELKKQLNRQTRDVQNLLNSAKTPEIREARRRALEQDDTQTELFSIMQMAQMLNQMGWVLEAQEEITNGTLTGINTRVTPQGDPYFWEKGGRGSELGLTPDFAKIPLDVDGLLHFDNQNKNDLMYAIADAQGNLKLISAVNVGLRDMRQKLSTGKISQALSKARTGTTEEMREAYRYLNFIRKDMADAINPGGAVSAYSKTALQDFEKSLDSKGNMYRQDVTSGGVLFTRLFDNILDKAFRGKGTFEEQDKMRQEATELIGEMGLIFRTLGLKRGWEEIRTDKKFSQIINSDYGPAVMLALRQEALLGTDVGPTTEEHGVWLAYMNGVRRAENFLLPPGSRKTQQVQNGRYDYLNQNRNFSRTMGKLLTSPDERETFGERLNGKQLDTTRTMPIKQEWMVSAANQFAEDWKKYHDLKNVTNPTQGQKNFLEDLERTGKLSVFDKIWEEGQQIKGESAEDYYRQQIEAIASLNVAGGGMIISEEAARERFAPNIITQSLGVNQIRDIYNKKVSKEKANKRRKSIDYSKLLRDSISELMADTNSRYEKGRDLISYGYDEQKNRGFGIDPFIKEALDSEGNFVLGVNDKEDLALKLKNGKVDFSIMQYGNSRNEKSSLPLADKILAGNGVLRAMAMPFGININPWMSGAIKEATGQRIDLSNVQAYIDAEDQAVKSKNLIQKNSAGISEFFAAYVNKKKGQEAGAKVDLTELEDQYFSDFLKEVYRFLPKEISANGNRLFTYTPGAKTINLSEDANAQQLFKQFNPLFMQAFAKAAGFDGGAYQIFAGEGDERKKISFTKKGMADLYARIARGDEDITYYENPLPLALEFSYMNQLDYGDALSKGGYAMRFGNRELNSLNNLYSSASLSGAQLSRFKSYIENIKNQRELSGERYAGLKKYQTNAEKLTWNSRTTERDIDASNGMVIKAKDLYKEAQERGGVGGINTKNGAVDSLISQDLLNLTDVGRERGSGQFLADAMDRTLLAWVRTKQEEKWEEWQKNAPERIKDLLLTAGGEKAVLNRAREKYYDEHSNDKGSFKAFSDLSSKTRKKYIEGAEKELGASMITPYVDWGGPEGFEGFLAHTSDGRISRYQAVPHFDYLRMKGETGEDIINIGSQGLSGERLLRGVYLTHGGFDDVNSPIFSNYYSTYSAEIGKLAQQALDTAAQDLTEKGYSTFDKSQTTLMPHSAYGKAMSPNPKNKIDEVSTSKKTFEHILETNPDDEKLLKEAHLAYSDYLVAYYEEALGLHDEEGGRQELTNSLSKLKDKVVTRYAEKLQKTRKEFKDNTAQEVKETILKDLAEKGDESGYASKIEREYADAIKKKIVEASTRGTTAYEQAIARGAKGGISGNLLRHPLITGQDIHATRLLIDSDLDPKGVEDKPIFRMNDFLLKLINGDVDGDTIGFALAYGDLRHYIDLNDSRALEKLNSKEGREAFIKDRSKALNTDQKVLEKRLRRMGGLYRALDNWGQTDATAGMSDEEKEASKSSTGSHGQKVYNELNDEESLGAGSFLQNFTKKYVGLFSNIRQKFSEAFNLSGINQITDTSNAMSIQGKLSADMLEKFLSLGEQTGISAKKAQGKLGFGWRDQLGRIYDLIKNPLSYNSDNAFEYLLTQMQNAGLIMSEEEAAEARQKKSFGAYGIYNDEMVQARLAQPGVYDAVELGNKALRLERGGDQQEAESIFKALQNQFGLTRNDIKEVGFDDNDVPILTDDNVEYISKLMPTKKNLLRSREVLGRFAALGNLRGILPNGTAFSVNRLGDIASNSDFVPGLTKYRKGINKNGTQAIYTEEEIESLKKIFPEGTIEFSDDKTGFHFTDESTEKAFSMQSEADKAGADFFNTDILGEYMAELSANPQKVENILKGRTGAVVSASRQWSQLFPYFYKNGNVNLDILDQTKYSPQQIEDKAREMTPEMRSQYWSQINPLEMGNLIHGYAQDILEGAMRGYYSVSYDKISENENAPKLGEDFGKSVESGTFGTPEFLQYARRVSAEVERARVETQGEEGDKENKDFFNKVPDEKSANGEDHGGSTVLEEYYRTLRQNFTNNESGLIEQDIQKAQNFGEAISQWVFKKTGIASAKNREEQLARQKALLRSSEFGMVSNIGDRAAFNRGDIQFFSLEDSPEPFQKISEIRSGMSGTLGIQATTEDTGGGSRPLTSSELQDELDKYLEKENISEENKKIAQRYKNDLDAIQTYKKQLYWNITDIKTSAHGGMPTEANIFQLAQYVRTAMGMEKFLRHKGTEITAPIAFESDAVKQLFSDEDQKIDWSLVEKALVGMKEYTGDYSEEDIKRVEALRATLGTRFEDFKKLGMYQILRNQGNNDQAIEDIFTASYLGLPVQGSFAKTNMATGKMEVYKLDYRALQNSIQARSAIGKITDPGLWLKYMDSERGLDSILGDTERTSMLSALIKEGQESAFFDKLRSGENGRNFLGGIKNLSAGFRRIEEGYLKAQEYQEEGKLAEAESVRRHTQEFIDTLSSDEKYREKKGIANLRGLWQGTNGLSDEEKKEFLREYGLDGQLLPALETEQGFKIVDENMTYEDLENLLKEIDEISVREKYNKSSKKYNQWKSNQKKIRELERSRRGIIGAKANATTQEEADLLGAQAQEINDLIGLYYGQNKTLERGFIEIDPKTRQFKTETKKVVDPITGKEIETKDFVYSTKFKKAKKIAELEAAKEEREIKENGIDDYRALSLQKVQLEAQRRLLESQLGDSTLSPAERSSITSQISKIDKTISKHILERIGEIGGLLNEYDSKGNLTKENEDLKKIRLLSEEESAKEKGAAPYYIVGQRVAREGEVEAGTLKYYTTENDARFQLEKNTRAMLRAQDPVEKELLRLNQEDLMRTYKQSVANTMAFEKMHENDAEYQGEEGILARNRYRAGLIYQSKMQQLDKQAPANVAQTSGVLDFADSKIGGFAKMMISQYGMLTLFRKLTQSFSKLKQEAEQLDQTLTNLRIVTGDTKEDTRNLINNYAELAQSLGVTTTAVANSAVEWMRQGYSVSESMDLVKSSIYLSTLGMMDSAKATQALTSSLKGFKLQATESMDIVDKLTALDLEAATSAGEIAEGLSQFANLGSLSGVGLDEAAAYVATIADVTQKTGSETGQSMKMILSRYGNVKSGKYNQLNVDSEGQDTSESVNDVETVLKKIGISIRDSTLEFKDFDEVMAEIADKWDTLGTVSQRAISTAFAGTRQQESFITLMNNWDKYETLLETSKKSKGTAEEKYQSYEESITAAKNALTASIEEIVNSSEFSEIILNVTNLLKEVVDFLPIIIKWAPQIVLALQDLRAFGGNSVFQKVGRSVWDSAPMAGFRGMWEERGSDKKTWTFGKAARGFIGISGRPKVTGKSVSPLDSTGTVSREETVKSIEAEVLQIKEQEKAATIEAAQKTEQAAAAAASAAEKVIAASGTVGGTVAQGSVAGAKSGVFVTPRLAQAKRAKDSLYREKGEYQRVYIGPRVKSANFVSDTEETQQSSAEAQSPTGRTARTLAQAKRAKDSLYREKGEYQRVYIGPRVKSTEVISGNLNEQINTQEVEKQAMLTQNMTTQKQLQEKSEIKQTESEVVQAELSEKEKLNKMQGVQGAGTSSVTAAPTSATVPGMVAPVPIGMVPPQRGVSNTATSTSSNTTTPTPTEKSTTGVVGGGMGGIIASLIMSSVLSMASTYASAGASHSKIDYKGEETTTESSEEAKRQGKLAATAMAAVPFIGTALDSILGISEGVMKRIDAIRDGVYEAAAAAQAIQDTISELSGDISTIRNGVYVLDGETGEAVDNILETLYDSENDDAREIIQSQLVKIYERLGLGNEEFVGINKVLKDYKNGNELAARALEIAEKQTELATYLQSQAYESYTQRTALEETITTLLQNVSSSTSGLTQDQQASVIINNKMTKNEYGSAGASGWDYVAQRATQEENDVASWSAGILRDVADLPEWTSALLGGFVQPLTRAEGAVYQSFVEEEISDLNDKTIALEDETAVNANLYNNDYETLRKYARDRQQLVYNNIEAVEGVSSLRELYNLGYTSESLEDSAVSSIVLGRGGDSIDNEIASLEKIKQEYLSSLSNGLSSENAALESGWSEKVEQSLNLLYSARSSEDEYIQGIQESNDLSNELLTEIKDEVVEGLQADLEYYKELEEASEEIADYFDMLYEKENEIALEAALIEAKDTTTDTFLSDLTIAQGNNLGTTGMIESLALATEANGGLHGVDAFSFYDQNGDLITDNNVSNLLTKYISGILTDQDKSQYTEDQLEYLEEYDQGNITREITTEFESLALAMLKTDEELKSAINGDNLTLSEVLDKISVNTTDKYEKAILENFATAIGTTIGNLETYISKFGELKLSELIKGTSELIEEQEEYEDLMKKITDSQESSTEWMNTIISKYPELIEYMSDTPALLEQITQKMYQLSQIELTSQWNEIASQDDVFKNLFKGQIISAIREQEGESAAQEAEAYIDSSGATNLQGLIDKLTGANTNAGIEKILWEILDTYQIGEGITLVSDTYQEGLKNYIDYNSKLLEKQLTNLNNQKEALEQITSQREYENKLIEAKLKLEDALSSKQRVYREGVGFVYEPSQESIKEAKENLEEVSVEKSVSEIQKQIDVIQQEKDSWDNIWEKQNFALLKEESEQFEQIYFEDERIRGISSNISDKLAVLVDGYKEFFNEQTGAVIGAIENNKEESIKNVYSAYEDYLEALKANGNDENNATVVKAFEKFQSLAQEAMTKGYLTDLYNGMDIVTGVPNVDTSWPSGYPNLSESAQNQLDISTSAKTAFGNTTLGKIYATGLTKWGTQDVYQLIQKDNHLSQDEWVIPSGSNESNVSLKEGYTFDENNISEDSDPKVWNAFQALKSGSDSTLYKYWTEDTLYTGGTNINSGSRYWPKSDEDFADFADRGLGALATYLSETGKEEAIIQIRDASGTDYYWKIDDTGALSTLTSSTASTDKVLQWANATGTLSLEGEENSLSLGLLNELGTEAIITPSGTVTALPSKTGIVPADITKNLWQLGEIAPSIARVIESLPSKIQTISNSTTSSVDESFKINSLTMNVNADKGFDANAFVQDVKNRIALTRNLRKA